MDLHLQRRSLPKESARMHRARWERALIFDRRLIRP
jgi:hypothetical protein